MHQVTSRYVNMIVIITLLSVLAPLTSAATGRLLADSGLYPRAIRLQHSDQANGRILASVVAFNGNSGIGAIYESTDNGENFQRIGEVADPEAANGQGECCATLYELPQQVGQLPAGTLLWSASVGADRQNRRMSIRVFKSNDNGRSWEYLSTVATANNEKGLWEPEFSIDSSGHLVCHYSDETDSAYSQKLMVARSTDGVNWEGHHETISSNLNTDRPGMAIVRKLPSGTYFMAYEICSAAGQYICVVHYRTSSDGWDWGDPKHLGYRPETGDGKYFKHTPNVGLAGNKLFLVGQIMENRDGSRADASGAVVWTNTDDGAGTWREIASPVRVESNTVDYCPNYSSALLPSEDGNQLLEIATDYDGSACRPYYATGSG